jgi:hypothetical protein
VLPWTPLSPVTVPLPLAMVQLLTLLLLPLLLLHATATSMCYRTCPRNSGHRCATARLRRLLQRALCLRLVRWIRRALNRLLHSL